MIFKRMLKSSIMKRRYIIILIAAVIGFTIISGYTVQFDRIGNKYAENFGRVLGSYDISKVDNYLDKDTVIFCKGKKEKYSELRGNIIQAFKSKKFKLSDTSSYGSGSGRFLSNLQEINVEFHVQKDFQERPKGDNLAILEIERKGINMYKIKSIKSEASFIEQLFFGEAT